MKNIIKNLFSKNKEINISTWYEESPNEAKEYILYLLDKLENPDVSIKLIEDNKKDKTVVFKIENIERKDVKLLKTIKDIEFVW